MVAFLLVSGLSSEESASPSIDHVGAVIRPWIDLAAVFLGGLISRKNVPERGRCRCSIRSWHHRRRPLYRSRSTVLVQVLAYVGPLPCAPVVGVVLELVLCIVRARGKLTLLTRHLVLSAAISPAPVSRSRGL